MTNEHFSQVIDEQLAYCRGLLVSKGQEYAGENVDRLAAFKKAAVLTGGTQRAALFGMLAKHLVSVADMCNTSADFPAARWEEKITDTINYMLLLRAVVEEERK